MNDIIIAKNEFPNLIEHPIDLVSICHLKALKIKLNISAPEATHNQPGFELMKSRNIVSAKEHDSPKTLLDWHSKK